MIITQTPFRMSFFGGGTDMESFFRENGGAVLSTTFDKYCYVNVRHLPRFFDYSTELSYSKTERVTCIEDIQHPAIRNAMKMLDILHERERKALIIFSALERQEEKLSAEKAELVKLRVALYEQYADGNMSKEEFIRQRDAYRVQEDERMEQIQRLRTEKDQIFQPVKKDTDNLQAMMNTVGEAGDVMHLSQNVVEAFIDRIEVFNDERVKIHFTFEDVLADHAE